MVKFVSLQLIETLLEEWVRSSKIYLANSAVAAAKCNFWIYYRPKKFIIMNINPFEIPCVILSGGKALVWEDKSLLPFSSNSLIEFNLID